MPFAVPYAPSSIFQPNGRLVDLIRLKGEQDAESERRRGELQARMWGSIGQTITEGVGNVIKAQQQAPVNALNALKVADATHEAQGKTALADTMRMQPMSGPMPPGEQRPAPSNPYLKQEGDVSVWDVEGLSKAMAAQGFGDLTSSVVKDISVLNDAHRAEAKARRDFGDAQQNVLARGAGTILSILKDHPDADPAMVTNLVGQQMAANSTFPPEQIQKTIQQLLSDPATLRTKLETLSKLGTITPIKLNEGDVLLSGTNPTGAPIAANLKAEKPTEASLAATANDPAKTPAERAAATAALAALQAPTTAAHTETERHNKEVERIAKLTEGKAEAAQRETARHNKAMEDAANPFGGAPTGANGVAGPTGVDFLKTLPLAQQAQVKALAEGRQPFPTGMSYAKLQPLIAAVTQYDPTFDAANYTARSKARVDLTSPSGTGGKTINSLNTAIQHLGRLSDLVEAEDNFEIPLANAVVNPLRTATGSTKVTNFNAVQPQAMKEIERLWRGSGGSQGEIDALKESLSKNAGKQQQREALQEFVNLVRGKLESTEQQRDNIMGPAAKDVPIIFEKNKAVLDKIVQRAGGASGSGISVTSPSGKSYPFPDQASADRFVADAKAKGLWK